MEPAPDCCASYHQDEKLRCLLCNIHLPREPVDVDSSQAQPSSEQEQANQHDRASYPCDDTDELTTSIKVEVLDEEGRILGWANCSSQDQPEKEQPTNLDELLHFLRSHFNMSTAGRTSFCESCSGRLRFLHKLWMQLTLLQKEFRKLSSEIDIQYKNACHTRKHLTQAPETEVSQLGGINLSDSDSNAQDLILRQNHSSRSTDSSESHGQITDITGYPSDEEWIPSPEALVSNASQNDSNPASKKRKRGINARANIVADIADDAPVPVAGRDRASVTPCVVKLERLQSSDLPVKIAPTAGDPCVQKRKRKRNSKEMWNRKGGPFPCAYCPKQLTTRSGRDIHHRIHTGENPYACHLCDNKFYKRYNLTQHLLAHTSLKKHYVCHTCGSSFIVKHLLMLHLESVHGLSENTCSCTVCSEAFKTPRELKKHIASVHTVKPQTKKDARRRHRRKFHCDACAKSFESRKLLRKHHMKEHKIGAAGEGLLTCKDCQKEFVNETKYNQHVEICKQLVDSKLKAKGSTKMHLQRLLCPICGRLCSGTANLHKHIKIQHEGARPYQCSVCLMKFTASNCLKVHMFQHTGRKANACDYCEETFGRLRRKREHLVKVHSDQYLKEKPVYCVHCYANFSSEDDLPAHFAKVHEKNTCRKCNPMKVLATSQGYKKHLCIHTGEKPFQCPHCPKAFNKKENRQEHVNRHTGRRPHVCQYCGDGFFRRKELANHVQKTHGEAGEEPTTTTTTM